MRITTQDVNSLMFACTLINSVREQTLNEKHRHNMEIHAHRVRKCYLILLSCASDRYFDFEKACTAGIPDNSASAKSVRSLTQKADDAFDESAENL
jgi:hypothetical protein